MSSSLNSETLDTQNPKLVSYVNGLVRSIMITEMDVDESGSSESSESSENVEVNDVATSEVADESEKQHTSSEIGDGDGDGDGDADGGGDLNEDADGDLNGDEDEDEDSGSDSENALEPEDELKNRLKWLYAIRIVKDFARKYEQGVYFIDEFEGVMCGDDLYENIRAVKIKYGANGGFTVSQTFDATHGKHIVENIKIPKSGHTYVSAALCSLVKKFGYNLEYKMDFEITVFTNKYVYMCDSQVNGEYIFHYESVLAGTP